MIRARFLSLLFLGGTACLLAACGSSSSPLPSGDGGLGGGDGATAWRPANFYVDAFRDFTDSGSGIADGGAGTVHTLWVQDIRWEEDTPYRASGSLATLAYGEDNGVTFQLHSAGTGLAEVRGAYDFAATAPDADGVRRYAATFADPTGVEGDRSLSLELRRGYTGTQGSWAGLTYTEYGVWSLTGDAVDSAGVFAGGLQAPAADMAADNMLGATYVGGAVGRVATANGAVYDLTGSAVLSIADLSGAPAVTANFSKLLIDDGAAIYGWHGVVFADMPVDMANGGFFGNVGAVTLAPSEDPNTPAPFGSPTSAFLGGRFYGEVSGGVPVETGGTWWLADGQGNMATLAFGAGLQ